MKLIKEIAQMHIDAELNRAAEALKEGNDGMARVCARRASGIAITYWLQNNPREGYGESAMNQLRSIQKDETVPEEIKEAAERLTTHVKNKSDSPFSDNPIEDAKVIIEYFMNH